MATIKITNPVGTHPLYKCASPTCPGLPFKPSELAHPARCGAPTYDVEVRREGSIFLFTPLNDAARDWIEEQVSDPLWFGKALAVEHRYAWDLCCALGESGLQVGP